MKKYAKTLCIVLGLLMMLSLIAACNSDSPAATPAPAETSDSAATPDPAETSDPAAPADPATSTEDLPFVDLSFYMVSEPTSEWPVVQDYLNEKLLADINANVEFFWISWGEREMRYPLILASGEPIDLILTGTWLQFNMEASNGSFLDITDLAPVYMPNYYAKIAADPVAIGMASPGGRMYGVPTGNLHWHPMGFIIRGDIADEVGFTKEIEGVYDYVDFMRLVAQHRPDMWTGDWSATTNDGLFSMWVRDMGYHYFPAWPPITMDVRGDGDIRSAFDIDGALDFFIQAKEWAEEGLWSMNVLSEPAADRLTDGSAASRHHNVSSWVNTYIQFPDWNVRWYPTGAPYTVRSRPMQDGTALPASSPNPERALMMLDLFHTQEDYFRVLAYGIEGVHYEITSAGQLRALMPEQHPPTFGPCMAFRTQEWLLPTEGAPPNLADINAMLEARGYSTPYSNFLPYFDNVIAERAAVMAVYHEQIGPLAYGLVPDVEAAFNRFRADLEAAGLYVILDEVLRQFEIFKVEFGD